MIYYLHFHTEKTSSRRYASNEAVMCAAFDLWESGKKHDFVGFDEPLNSDSCTIYNDANNVGYIITRFRDDAGIFHTVCDMYIKAREGLIHD